MSRIAQLATSPLLQNFAITSSQKAIRPIGNFISPICGVPDATFRYKKYTAENGYKPANTKRAPGGRATQISFSASDETAILEPNALDFPIPYADQLSDEALQYALQEGQSLLADASGITLENEIVQTAKAAALESKLSFKCDFTDNNIDPIPLIDDLILKVMLASRNGAPIKIVFGTTKFKQFRNNENVRDRYVVSNNPSSVPDVGLVSPNINDIGSLLMTKPEVQMSMMVIDTSAPGLPDDIQFILDDIMIVFASSSVPNRFDPSFMKTFSRFEGFFQSSAYTTQDQRDQVLKMDWTTLPKVTNPCAVAALF